MKKSSLIGEAVEPVIAERELIVERDGSRVEVTIHRPELGGSAMGMTSEAG